MLEGSTLDVDLQLGGLNFKIHICAERLHSIGNGAQNLRQFILEKSIICKPHAMSKWRASHFRAKWDAWRRCMSASIAGPLVANRWYLEWCAKSPYDPRIEEAREVYVY